MIRRLILLIPILAYAAGAAATDDAGTQPPVAFGIGARDLAMGGAGLAIADFTTAPYWNASRLAMAERLAISFSHSQLYESGVAYQYLGVAAPTLDFGTFGVGVFRLGVDGIEQRDAGNLLLGKIADDYLDFYLAYGRVLSGNNLGIAVTFQHHSLGQYSATTSPGVNLSISRRFSTRTPWLNSLTIASSGINLIRPRVDLNSQSLQFPRQFDGGITMGFGRKRDGSDAATASLSLNKTDQRHLVAATGVEYDWRNLVSARGGYRDGHLSLGAGLVYKNVRLDYALVDRDLGTIHMFTASFALGSSTSEKRSRRALKREAEFSSLFQQKLQSKNSQTLDQLLAQADSLRHEGDLKEAHYRYERALFVARNSGLDTARVAGSLVDTQTQLEEQERAETFSLHLDSAKTKFQAGDLLAAKYFANLAAQENPTSPEARSLQEQTETAIAKLASREELLHKRLTAVDSLLSYGRIEEAAVVANSLKEYAPEDDDVQFACRKVRFEQWRQRASTAFTDRDYRAARLALDSAIVLFPQHQWCQDLRTRLEAERRTATPPPRNAEVAQVRETSPEALKQADELYSVAQRAFRQGQLLEAVENWEQVERVASGYKSVREYLVSAYRLVGIELYGQNLLSEAIASWKKAEALNPNDKDIKAYIERTQAEILRVKELSYDQR